jgi:hypothetical protein
VSSLTTCIKKAGKALDAKDAETLRAIHDDLVAAKDPDPAGNAIKEFSRSIKAEQKLLSKEIAKKGGKVDSEPVIWGPNKQKAPPVPVPEPIPEPMAAAAEPTPEPEPAPDPKDSVLMALPKQTKDRINRDPTSPLAQAHKLGATLEDQANITPHRTTWRELPSLLTDTDITTVLRVVPTRNIKDFLPRHLAPALHKYNQIANRMIGRRNELATGYEEVARKWSKWMRKNQRMHGLLGDLMHATTMAGTDPSIEYAPLKKPQNMTAQDRRDNALRREQHMILKEYFDNQLDEEGREIYREVRDTYYKMRKGTEDALIKRIEQSKGSANSKRKMMDKLRKEFESGRVSGPYFPLMRYGDRWGVARDKKVAKGKKTGDTFSFVRFENRRDQNAWIKEMNEAGFDTDQGIRSQEDKELAGDIDPNFVSEIVELAKDAKADGLVDDIWQVYLDSLPERSIRKQSMHRKNRLGFSADALRAYANVSFRNAHQQSKLEYMHTLQGEMQNLKDQVRAIEGNKQLKRQFEWATPVYDEMKRRHDASQNPSASPWAVKLTGAGFLFYLGFTPAAAAVNLSQTALVGWPVLGAEFNHLGATKELLRAAKQFAGSRGSLESTLRGEELKAFKEASRIGLFEKTQANDLAGQTESGSATNYGGIEHRVTAAGSFMFHKAEEFNRQVTFMAAYRLAKQRGDSHADSVIMAENLTWDSHFDYNNDNRPLIMQNDVGRVVFLFKQYSLNMTYRMVRDFRDGIVRNPDISKSERNKAAQRFGGMMMMAGFLSGLSGLPTLLTAPIKFMLETFLGDEDTPYDADEAFRAHLADMFSPEAAEWIMKGPWDGGLGLTLSNRVALSQMWWRDPSPHDADDTAMQKLVLEALGPVVGTVAEMGLTAKKAATGDLRYPGRALERVVPKAVRDVMRVIRFADEGAMNQKIPQEAIVERDEFDTLDLFWQGVGFTPARLTMQYEQNVATQRAAKHIQDRWTLLKDQYGMAVFNKDKAEVDQVMARIAKFKKANPKFDISLDSLGTSVESRLKRKARSRGGVELEPKLRYLYDETSFTPKKEGK